MVRWPPTTDIAVIAGCGVTAARLPAPAPRMPAEKRRRKVGYTAGRPQTVRKFM
jgi:hypothetical protein